ncbi:MAG: response regulator transcription factor [Hormoscilla sp.]
MGKKILVVEDSETAADILTKSLKKAHFDVTPVTTAEAAKAILEKKTFDAIVMDVVLPGQSGYGLCRDLKGKEKTAHIPIIICSSKSGKIDKSWGMKQGADAYITKPIDPEEMLETVRSVVNE